MLIERVVASPIVPLDIFRNKTFLVSVPTVSLVSMGMFGTIVYTPIYAQGVMGFSATLAGLVMVPLTIGMVLASAVTGQYVSRTGQYRIPAVLGMVFATVGLFLLSRITPDTSHITFMAYMMVIGMGMGTSFPVFNVAVQNAFEHSRVGVVIASVQLFRNIGATVGTALFGSLMASTLVTGLGTLSSDPVGSIVALHTVDDLQKFLTPDGLSAARALVGVQAAGFDHFVFLAKDIFGSAITQDFAIASGLLLVATALSFRLPFVPLRHSQRPIAEKV